MHRYNISPLQKNEGRSMGCPNSERTQTLLIRKSTRAARQNGTIERWLASPRASHVVSPRQTYSTQTPRGKRGRLLLEVYRCVSHYCERLLQH